MKWNVLKVLCLKCGWHWKIWTYARRSSWFRVIIIGTLGITVVKLYSVMYNSATLTLPLKVERCSCICSCSPISVPCTTPSEQVVQGTPRTAREIWQYRCRCTLFIIIGQKILPWGKQVIPFYPGKQIIGCLLVYIAEYGQSMFFPVKTDSTCFS